MKLSIIICVYNTAAELLDECLTSIRNSTLEAMDYEICMVDDGSDIDYSALLGRFDVRYLKTENRGIFSARLEGIRMAEGDYIAFVDSDDTVSFNYHAPMVAMAERSDADIVYNDWAFRTRNTRYFCKGDSTVMSDVSADGDDTLLAFVRHEGRQHAYYVLWNKLYRRELIRPLLTELAFASASEERFNYSEDALMNFYLHKNARRIRSVHSGYYFYRLHDGQTVGVTSIGKLHSQIRQMSYTLSKMQTNIGKNEHFREISEHIEGWKRLMARTHYSYARANGYSELYPYIKERYGVFSLQRSIPRDGRAYERVGVLAENFTEVDEALLALSRTKEMLEVTIPKDGYTLRALSCLIKHGTPISTERRGNITLPRERVRLSTRLLFNPALRKLGMLLIPKGSRLRARLKSRI